MYNIKQAAARAGVSVPVLRAWERRYGIVRPARSAAGYRRFDDDAVARVRAMRALVDDGWSPSAAAAAILAGRVSVAAASNEPAESSGASTAATPDTTSDELAERLVDAARALDTAGLEATLDEMFSRGSFEPVAGELLFPALHRLGDAWAAGSVSVAGEHLASAAVMRRLGQALEAAGSQLGGTGRRIVVGLPPGGRHELGALAFAVAARRAGLPVAYVGPDLPLADWVSAVRGAAAAVVGVVSPRDRKAALEVARGVLEAQPGVVVAFGGRSAPDEPGVLRLEGSLPASVAALSLALEPAAP